MKNNQYLKIKGAVLDNEQLGTYMEKLALDHLLTTSSSLKTYPIPRLKENLQFIEKTYSLLNEHADKKIDIYPAGEWLLDNFYIIEETVKTVIKELTPKKYKNLMGIEGSGYSRIYAIGAEIISHTDGIINEHNINQAIVRYQKRKTLSMEEIWNLWLFLDIAIIENIRNICEKIYLAQMQKYKVENILERLIGNEQAKTVKFPIKDNNVGVGASTTRKQTSHQEMKYSFIEYMSYRLKQYGRRAVPYLRILEDQVSKMGMDISEVIQKEHFDIAVRKSFFRK